MQGLFQDIGATWKSMKYEPPLVKTIWLMRSPINYGLFNFQ